MTGAAGLELCAPLIGEAAFVARFGARAAELAEDLGIDALTPTYRAVPAAARVLLVDGIDVPLPALRPVQAADASSSAEAAAAALIRERWRLLRRALADYGVPERPALRQAAEIGLNLSQLVALHDAEGEDDALLWACAEQHHPTVAVLHGLDDAATERLASCLRSGAESAADRLGFAVPVPTLERDASLAAAQFRLRVRQLRGPVEPDQLPEDVGAMADVVAAALVRAGPSLLDAAVLLARLLNPKAVSPDFVRDALPPDFVRDALRNAPILRVVEALRPLLADGFLLVDPARLCEAMKASARPGQVLPPPGEGRRRLTLPGALQLAETPGDTADRLALYLRAALVPMSLRVFANRRGDRARISALTLAGATLAVLRGGGAPSIGWANRLGDAVAARTTEPGDVLLVPQDVRRQVRNLLAERVPGLPVIGPGEYPDGVKFLQRGRPLRIEERMPS